MSTLGSIAIIGAGAMGGAILGGLLAPGVTVDGDIRVTNRTEAKAALVRRPGVDSVALETTPDGNALAVRVQLGILVNGIGQTQAEGAHGFSPSRMFKNCCKGPRLARSGCCSGEKYGCKY